jgi:hypothetical protein
VWHDQCRLSFTSDFVTRPQLVLRTASPLLSCSPLPYGPVIGPAPIALGDIARRTWRSSLPGWTCLHGDPRGTCVLADPRGLDSHGRVDGRRRVRDLIGGPFGLLSLVVCGVQSERKVDGRNSQIPGRFVIRWLRGQRLARDKVRVLSVEVIW